MRVGKDDSYTKWFPFIVQVGTGGTGSYLVQHIAQALSVTKRPAAYCIADPDVVEEKNLGNQMFLASEVGLKKADVLARRYSAAYNVQIASYNQSYIEDVKQLKNCFNSAYMTTGYEYNNSIKLLPIIVGAVDNAFTRRIMNQLFDELNHVIYIDSGNETAATPVDWQVRSKDQWSDEEVETYQNSGWTGQIVVGFKEAGKVYLPPVCSVFPELLEDEEPKPSEASCSDLTASFPQRIIVNKMAAMGVANIITGILEEDVILARMVNFHAKKGFFHSLPTSLEQ